MSSKSKRRVTVDTGNAVSEDSEKRKPSVFERLGPGGGQRKYSEYDAGSSGDREREKKCRPYLLTGECPYGATCKYKHVQLSRKSKPREGEGSPENLRLKLKGQQSERSDKHHDSDSELADRPAGRSRHDKDESRDKASSHDRSRRDKETKIRSQVVVKKSSGNQGSDDSDASTEENWFESLDCKKEPELEQKLQQLQRELSQLEEEGGDGAAQKKLPLAHSGSDSSPDLGRSASGHRSSLRDKRSASPAGKKKEKKKHRTKLPVEQEAASKDKKAHVSLPALPPDKSKDHKKKYEAEEDSSHRKHKKNKKEKRRSATPPPDSLHSRKKEPDSDVSRLQTSSAGHDRVASPPPLCSKCPRSASSHGSISPPRSRSKDGKDKGQNKAKAKKKKGRGGKDIAGSFSDDSPAKSKKWLSPLTKTLKLKKAKGSNRAGDGKQVVDDNEAVKRGSPTPQPSQRSHSREFLAEDPLPLSRSRESAGKDWEGARRSERSVEKKKAKGKRSLSPRAPSSDKSVTRRGDAKRDGSFDDRRKRPTTPPPRQSELYSPSQLDRESPYRDPSSGRARQGQQPDAGRGERDFARDDGRRTDRDDRRGEKFDSQPLTPSTEHQGVDRYSRHGDGDSFDQYGQDRARFDSDRKRGDYREGGSQDADVDRDQRGRRPDRFSRDTVARARSKTDTAGRDSSYDRQQESVSGRDQSRDGRDQSRDGRDQSRDGRDGGGDQGRAFARNRGDNREMRERDNSRGGDGRFGVGGYGSESQRRGGQWDQSGRSSDWAADRSEAPALHDFGRDGGRRDERGREGRGAGASSNGSGTGSGGRLYRDDSRDSIRGSDRRGRDVLPEGRQQLMDSQRMDRGDIRLDRGDNRLERGDSRERRSDRGMDRGGDIHVERRERSLDRGGDSRVDRRERSLDRGGDGRVERRERSLDRGSDNRLDRRERSLDRGGDRNLDRSDGRLDRGDDRLDRRRGNQQVPPFEQRGFRGGRDGTIGASEGRGAMHGVGDRSPVDNRSFDFTRRGGREGQMGRAGDRDVRMDRDRDRDVQGMGGPSARDRYSETQPDFRPVRDDRGFREDFQDSSLLRDRHGDPMDRSEVFEARDGRSGRSRSGRGLDEVRDDRGVSRGAGEDRLGRERAPHASLRAAMYDFEQRPLSASSDSRNVSDSRRVPLLPTPADEASRHGMYEPERGGRETAREGRDDRGRRDQRDADFGVDTERASLSGRGGGHDPARDVAYDGRDWDRNSMHDREMGKELHDVSRELSRNAPRDLAQSARPSDGRRGRVSPSDPAAERERDWVRDDHRRDSPRRDGGKAHSSTSAQDLEAAKRQVDKGEERDRDRGAQDKMDVGDTRSTRSADDAREAASPRGPQPGGDMGIRAGSLRDVRDRDSQSDGKRSPARGRGKGRSPLPFPRSSSADGCQPKKARSLSPKQRKSTPPVTPSSSREAADKLRFPTAKCRSPLGRRGAQDSDMVPSPVTRPGRRARSRSPGGAKRKLDDRSRSPRPKDERRSPAGRRQREESRSPGRRLSRHPSPAGSQHSRSSPTSERRRHPASTHRDGEGRYSFQNRDSPTCRDRDKDRDTVRVSVEGSREEGDRSDSRKRGRSPAWSRTAEGTDRKRWRADGKPGDVAEAWGETGEADTGKQGAPRLSKRCDVEGGADSAQPDFVRASPTGLSSSATPFPTDKGGRRPRTDSVGSCSSHPVNEDGYASHDAWTDKQDDGGSRVDPVVSVVSDAEHHGELPSNQDGTDDSKDAGLSNVLDDDEYEEISSDEGDFDTEEDKQGQNIVSILDIDWASLAKEPAPKQTTGSLLKRFHPASIFHQIGVSRTLAGDALFEKVKAICEEGVEANDNKEKGVSEKSEDKENGESSGERHSTPAFVSTRLHHDVPSLHMASVRQKRERSNLLRNLGPFRRALCARRDLEIRRQLCKVDKVYEQPAVFPTHVMDADLCKLSIQLFRQGRDFADRKDSECDGKMDITI